MNTCSCVNNLKYFDVLFIFCNYIGPWCYVDMSNNNNLFRIEYCDVLKCSIENYEIFTLFLRDSYSHYIKLNEFLANFTFGVKLWDPDSVFSTGKLILTYFGIPTNSENPDESNVGMELIFSNAGNIINM